MQAIGNCVIACSSSICALEPELAVDGDAGALTALLSLIVQTFVVKKISKSRNASVPMFLPNKLCPVDIPPSGDFVDDLFGLPLILKIPKWPFMAALWA